MSTPNSLAFQARFGRDRIQPDSTGFAVVDKRWIDSLLFSNGPAEMRFLAKIDRHRGPSSVGRPDNRPPERDALQGKVRRLAMNWFSRRQRRLAPVVMMLIACLYLLWQWFMPQAVGQGIVGVGLVVLARLWLVWSAEETLNQRGLAPERFWRLLTTAAVLWLGADILRLIFLVLQGGPLESPTISDLFALAGNLAIFAAVFNYPLSSSERFGRLRNFLEVAIIALSVFTLYWLLVARAVLLVGMSSWVVLFWASLPVAFQLVLMILITRLWLHPHMPLHMMSFRYWIFGLGLIASTHFLAGYARILSSSVNGSWLEIGWLAGSLILARGFTEPFDALQDEIDVLAESTLEPAPYVYRLERWLPFVLTTAVVGITLVNWLLTRQFDWVGAGAGIALTVLLTARQGVIAGQAELQQYAALINASTDLAFICRPDGDLLLANPTLESWLGHSISEGETIVPEFIPDWSAIISDGGTGGWSGEARLVTAQGRTIPIVMSISPIQQGADLEPVLAVIAHDLTEIRAREEELRSALDEVARARTDLEILNRELEDKVEDRTSELEMMVQNLEKLNQELKEVDRLKSEFVALVSHELRAPLTTIRGGLEVVLEGSRGLPDKISQSMQLVQNETLRLSSFVEQILDLSALEAGRFALAIEPCSISAAVMIAARQIEQQKELPELDLDIPEDLPYVEADERALVSVIHNLLDNAVKYATGSKVEIRASEQESRILINVRDHGAGIPSADGERVFDMFHRLDSSDSREVYGYGLGLPMAKRLLLAMQGDIRLVTEEKPGACFEFWLPRATEELEVG
jgi:PAS domain S-box-containing protein